MVGLGLEFKILDWIWIAKYDSPLISAVSNPEQGDQMVYEVLCQTFTKSCQMHCQITSNIAKILQVYNCHLIECTIYT